MEQFVLAALTTFALTLYIVYDDGPLNIFKWARLYAGVNVMREPIAINGQNASAKDAMKAGLDIDLYSNGSLLAEILTCHRCTSFWSGLAVSVIATQSIDLLFIGGLVGFSLLANELLSSISGVSESMIEMIQAETGTLLEIAESMEQMAKVETEVILDLDETIEIDVSTAALEAS